MLYAKILSRYVDVDIVVAVDIVTDSNILKPRSAVHIYLLGDEAVLCHANLCLALSNSMSLRFLLLTQPRDCSKPFSRLKTYDDGTSKYFVVGTQYKYVMSVLHCRHEN
jgi:hypothetical protein